jgi:trehalose 6-phosphate phosphatase
MPETGTPDSSSSTSEASKSLPPIAIFTDFDGTLVDLAPTPDAIHVPSELADELQQSAEYLDGAIAVISGRAIADLDQYIRPMSVALAGSHGVERRRTDGSQAPIDADRSAKSRQLAERLQEFVASHPGLLLETKPATVALHYRQLPEQEEACIEAMQAAIADVPQFSLLRGKMVVEARPQGFTKGAALRAFLEEEPFRGRLPIFLGDDVTDEEGFDVAQELGGIGIKVGEGETHAHMRTPDTATARAIIRDLAARAARR